MVISNIRSYINHVALVLDASGSMSGLDSQLVNVADAQIRHLAQRSKELDQETRVTVYSFNNRTKIECLVYDKDVLRLPSLRGLYHSDYAGQTALLDATIVAMTDLAQAPEIYGDHAFLIYVLTDGEENNSRNGPQDLAARLTALKDNWTVAVFVPNAHGLYEAKKFGFPMDNIAVWNTSARGVEEVGETIRRTTDSFMTARASGMRGSRSLFKLDTSQLPNQVQRGFGTADLRAKGLSKLGPGQFRIFSVNIGDSETISTFVEEHTGRAYVLGEAYYELTKPVVVQAGKKLALLDKKNWSVYTGAEARKLLGLPDYEVKVTPASHPDYTIFVQSTSVNRKLFVGTSLLLL